ncbi:hypothetical protein QYF36_006865 [Acer negundo]|nr:hypothetical protein QYF36_006865 [Acer negundo]
MGLFSVCEEGEFRGSSNPSPLGKNDMLVINEGSNCSGVLDRNSKMVPTSAIFSDREILECPDAPAGVWVAFRAGRLVNLIQGGGVVLLVSGQ